MNTCFFCRRMNASGEFLGYCPTCYDLRENCIDLLMAGGSLGPVIDYVKDQVMEYEEVNT